MKNSVIKAYMRLCISILLILLLITLPYLVVLPLLSIVRDTFVVHASEKSRIKQAVGSFTMYHWARAFASNFSSILVWEPLWHSVYTSVLACVVSIQIGGGFAWMVTRTDLMWKKVLTKLFIFPYIMPSWTLALAWRNFFKNPVVGGAPGGVLFHRRHRQMDRTPDDARRRRGIWLGFPVLGGRRRSLAEGGGRVPARTVPGCRTPAARSLERTCQTHPRVLSWRGTA